MTAIRQTILSLIFASLVASPAVSQATASPNCSLLDEPHLIRHCMIQSRIADMRIGGDRITLTPLTKGSLISGEEVIALEAREQMIEMVNDGAAFASFGDDNRWIFAILLLLLLLGLGGSGSGSGGGSGGEPISPS